MILQILILVNFRKQFTNNYFNLLIKYIKSIIFLNQI